MIPFVINTDRCNPFTRFNKDIIRNKDIKKQPPNWYNMFTKQVCV